MAGDLAGLALWVLAAVNPPHQFYACAAASKGYVVGNKLPPSGLFVRAGEWRQLGYNHPFIAAVDYDRRDPRVLYLAAGNGCVRSPDGGRTWRITTSWDMTEPKDVSVDPSQSNHIYLALPDGIGVSRDQGRTWSRQDSGIERKYTQAIRVDRTAAGRVLAGAERGIFLTGNGGHDWRLVGADGAMVTHLEQSPHEPGWWIAATQQQGAWESRDGGLGWKRVLGGGSTLHNTAFDPTRRDRLAVCGWEVGVMVSEDGGRSWTARNSGLPSRHVWRVAFDPDRAGRIYAGVHEEALYVSDDAGRHWRSAGLEGAVIYNLAFIPAREP